MKLRTEIVQVDGETHLTLGVSPGRYTAKEHDAMAAHALLQAMAEWGERTYSESVDKLAVRWIRLRAAEILAGWLGEEVAK